jgi:L-lactate dehydrogenase complex protein LldG
VEAAELVSARDAILARVREALQAKGSHENPATDSGLDDSIAASRRVLPAVPPDLEGQVQLFGELSANLRTEFLRCTDESSARAQMVALAEREKWESIAFAGNQQIESLLVDIGIPKANVNAGISTLELEKVSVGVTGCDALIAQTGGVLLSARSSGGRALSVLPPHHVVIATNSQLVPDLPAAFELLERKYTPDFPSFITFITGPSRTGDIERILVLGAHGPRKLTVMLIGETNSEQ